MKMKKINIVQNLTGQIDNDYSNFKKISINGNINLIDFAKKKIIS